MSRQPVELATRVGPIELPNPVATAAGTAGHGAELAAYFDLSELGALVVKSLSCAPWPGNAAPRVHPVAGGMLNSVGLQGPGIPAWIEHVLPALERSGARVIASLWGTTVDDFARGAELFAVAPSAVVALEVNVSCPNRAEGGKMFAQSAESTAAVIAAAAGARRPLFAKLSATAPDLVEVAGAALAAGAAGLTLINTLPAMAIDLERRRPVLGAASGGLSGPALHAIAVRSVFECRRAFPTTGIFGVGGVLSGEDAIELLLAGADAVQVGTATFAEPKAALRVLGEIVAWCERHGVAAVRDLVGAVHREPMPHQADGTSARRNITNC
ncbi:MAG: dihydroorotate dehydrogenase [Actinomycetota bacterium]|jgi:dihydroorotate dehydrogenase (NAD+) catalytic subunit|nr:dihydroorotate dehydrogenase [Actinomycetota bacterium]